MIRVHTRPRGPPVHRRAFFPLVDMTVFFPKTKTLATLACVDSDIEAQAHSQQTATLLALLLLRLRTHCCRIFTRTQRRQAL